MTPRNCLHENMKTLRKRTKIFKRPYCNTTVPVKGSPAKGHTEAQEHRIEHLPEGVRRLPGRVTGYTKNAAQASNARAELRAAFLASQYTDKERTQVTVLLSVALKARARSRATGHSDTFRAFSRRICLSTRLRWIDSRLHYCGGIHRP